MTNVNIPSKQTVIPYKNIRLKQVNKQFTQFEPVFETHNVKPSVFVIATYPPKECGIATYSKDLVTSLNKLFSGAMDVRIGPVCAAEDQSTFQDFQPYCLTPDNPDSFDNLAAIINEDPTITIVMIQHEFGLYKTNPEKFLDFLVEINKPIVLELHTVLPNPDEEFRQYVKQMIMYVDHIIVMTQTSRDILLRNYSCDPNKVEVIHHGTHLVAHKNKEDLKQKFGYEGKTILTTFGLLGPGKSIETTLYALPSLIEKHPNLLFLILGKTHPGELQTKGETYRDKLTGIIKSLHLENNVQFVNKFLPLDDLLEYLQLSDIYLFTSKDPNQAVSGTFSYAMSCGCTVISTPIPHAIEFLGHDKGILFEFGDSEGLAQKIDVLLSDSAQCKTLGMNGLQASSSSAWENSAIAHAKLLARFSDKIDLKFNIPVLDFNHLEKMTTSVGLVQFSILNNIDLSSGYTLDDNARALIVMCTAYEQKNDNHLLGYILKYFNFVNHCQRADGTFLNYVDENKKFTDQNDMVNLEDSNGRAIWALGELIRIQTILPIKYQHLIEQAEECLTAFFPHLENINSPRTLAFAIKGLYAANTVLNRPVFEESINFMASKLAHLYEHEARDNWSWFESYLTYGNSVLPEAMLIAHITSGNEIFKQIAFDSLDFLTDLYFREGEIRVISNQTWFKRGDKIDNLPLGGQQAIDVAYMILALKRFHDYEPELGFDDKIKTAFSWFLGNNHLHQTVYNPCTKGCYDGIETNNINVNQGAESMVSYLLSRLVMNEID